MDKVVENVILIKHKPPLEEIDEILDNAGFDDRKKIMAIDYVIWKSKQQAPITKRQKEVLDYIKSFELQKGYSPSLTEVGMGLGLKAISTVHEHIRLLTLKGYLQKNRFSPRGVSSLDSLEGK